VQAALEMHELGVRMYRQRMHREHPQATRREIDGMITTWRAERPHAGKRQSRRAAAARSRTGSHTCIPTHHHAVGRDHRRRYLREVPDLFTGALRGGDG